MQAANLIDGSITYKALMLFIIKQIALFLNRIKSIITTKGGEK